MAKKDKDYQIMIFGKAGCDKCAVLEKRVDSLITKPDWQEFGKLKIDVESEEGLVEFCQCECVNPQRIPAFVVQKWNDKTKSYENVQNPSPSSEDDVCGNSKLYTLMGIQTDYTERGKGLISPKMIKSVLQEAKSV